MLRPIKPISFLRKTFSRENWQVIKAQLYDPRESDERKAFSAAFGVFMGIVPIWGFQTVAAIFLAVLFKLNKALVVLFTQVSFPPFIPVIIFLSYKVGGFFFGKNHTEITFSKKLSLAVINQNFAQYILGSLALAISAGVAIGLITYAVLKVFKKAGQSKTIAAQKNHA